MLVREAFGSLRVWHNRETFLQDDQNGRPARPQASRSRRRTLRGYVEDFDEPRTKLADFFSILLDDMVEPLVAWACKGER